MPKILAYTLGGLLIGLGMFVFLHYSYYQEYPNTTSDILPAALATVFAALTLWVSWRINILLDKVLEWEKSF